MDVYPSLTYRDLETAVKDLAEAFWSFGTDGA